MQRLHANVISLYIRELSICGISLSTRVLKSVPHRCRGMTASVCLSVSLSLQYILRESGGERERERGRVRGRERGRERETVKFVYFKELAHGVVLAGKSKICRAILQARDADNSDVAVLSLKGGNSGSGLVLLCGGRIPFSLGSLRLCS